MTGYLLRRAGQMALTLFLIITLTFFLVEAQPGDYASFYVLNPDLPPDVKDQIRASFGLDKPLWQQYLIHLKNTFTGNFGVSFGYYPRSVLDVVAERLPRTLMLFLTANTISFYFGFFLGKAIAWRRGGPFEYAATISGATLFTAFTPAFALMMIWVFAFKLGWFPVGKFLDPLVWSGADVSANYVFGYMLLSVAAFAAFALLAVLLLMTFGRRVPSVFVLATLLMGVLVIALAWAFSGIGGWPWTSSSTWSSPWPP